jgi:hypothetical protein
MAAPSPSLHIDEDWDQNVENISMVELGYELTLVLRPMQY